MSGARGQMGPWLRQSWGGWAEGTFLNLSAFGRARPVQECPLGRPCASLQIFALSAGPDVGVATLGGQTLSLEGGC